jgi:hypothetical protein
MTMAVNSTRHCWFSVTLASGKVSGGWLLLRDCRIHCASTSLLRFKSRVVVSDLRGGGLWWVRVVGSEAYTGRFKVLLVTVHEIGTDWFQGRGAVYSKWIFVCGTVTAGCAG